MCPCSSDGLESVVDFPYDVADLLPQSKQMVLLDKVIAANENVVVVELTVRDDGLFSDEHQTVPAWLGIEYMAQAVAAFSGYQRKCKGQDIDLGFLLGTRYYQCSVGQFLCGTKLTIRAEKIIEAANDMVVFDCHLHAQDIEARAKLNLLMPQDSKQFLSEKGI